MATILDHIDTALKAKGLKDATASRLAAGNPSLIKNIRSGAGNVGYESLQKLAAVLDLELYFGPPRGPTVVEQVSIDEGEYARIPLHGAWLSAGPGVANGDVAIIDHLVFREEWLRKIEVRPETAAMARISGDSMAPGIRDGDLVMIDTTKREVPVRRRLRRPDQLPIFAFMQDSEARVKRLERLPKERVVVLYSDNKDIPPEVIAESEVSQLNILGQVVWSGHVWR